MEKKEVISLLVQLAHDPRRLVLERLKKRWAKQAGTKLPKNYELLAVYRKAVKNGELPVNAKIEEALVAKPIRTLSGVAPVTVILKPAGCSGHCVYCPSQAGVPKSYLDDEPAVLRARQFHFAPADQMAYRLGVFEKMGHSAQKVELIILGGTFSDYPRRYRRDFIRACFEAANGRAASSLLAAQGENETALHRIVGVTIETRPDCVSAEEIRFWRLLGVTRVEIGVQSLYPRILKMIKRPHGLKEVIDATALLRRAGFKICYHLMPGLPGATPITDCRMFKKVFSQNSFRPDYLKIYPCVVIRGTEMFDWWRAGRFEPLTDQALRVLLAKVKKELPEYVRVNRLGRDIPLGNIEAGFRYSHLRQLVQEEMLTKGWRCRCLRCREVRDGKKRPFRLKTRFLIYSVKEGREIFFQAVDRSDRLYAFLRLFLPSPNVRPELKILAGAALVRELHTYGPAVEVGENKQAASQHHGLGKALLRRAERWAKRAGYGRMAVIAGIGVRNYYRSQGYCLKRTYLIKKI